MPPHTVPRVLYRYLAGRPLDGRPDHPYLSRGAGRWPGWRRQLVRLAVPAAAAAGALEPQGATTMAAVAGAAAAAALRRRWTRRRFRREYIAPTLAALSVPLGGAPARLHVDPSLGNLTPRLAKPLSPAEVAVRAWYGEHVEPVLRYLPDQAMRARWALQRAATPVTRRLEVLRRPAAEDAGPRIELTADTPYLSAEQRQHISAVIKAKIPAGELVESWDQVGPRVTARWTVRRRPPGKAGYADLDARLGNLAECEFFVGLGVGGKPVTVSLHDDSPHICVSASSGAGKSVLAQAVAVQVLARGGQVVILDIKGSHRWAVGLPGVAYCTSVPGIHDALVRLGTLAEQRNTRALGEPEGWDPGPRHLIIFEELNSTMDLLYDHWAEIRDRDEPKKSPAIRATKQVLTMGRSAKVNVIGVAQMLTARAIGGPEARECFAIRFLARYSANAWKMLAAGVAMPRVSRTLGRWQVVVGGVAVEVQVVYLSPAEARLFVNKHRVSPTADPALMGADLDLSPGQAPAGDTAADPLSEPVTLREAVRRGICPWAFEATKKRLQRARKAASATVPAPAGKEGLADTYRVGDLIVWVESELVS